MKNIPGTVLIVRKKQKLVSTSKDNTSYKLPSYIKFTGPFNENVFVPYGDNILLLKINKTLTLASKTQKYKLHAFYKENKISITGSNRQFNKWFATVNQWKKYGHDKNYKFYLKNKDIHKTWKQCKQEYRIP